ncbi:MAG: EAL domain-containing protein [Lachnospiraceae bacterium]|nr:EAL domain-containing protein [Lachnospiraceae bacterium]
MTDAMDFDIQSLQDHLYDLTGIGACALGRDSAPLTTVSGDEETQKLMEELMHAPFFSMLLDRVGEDSIEDLTVETLENGTGECYRIGVMSIKIAGSPLMYWILACPETFSEQRFLNLLDLLRSISGAICRDSSFREDLRELELRSVNAREEESKAIRTLEATKAVLQLLDSDQTTEAVLSQWAEIVGDYLQVDKVQVFRLGAEGMMDVIVERLSTGVLSVFDEKKNVPIKPFLDTEGPLVLSTESLYQEEYKPISDQGILALMIFPLLAGKSDGEGRMVASMVQRDRGRSWTGTEVKFAADAAKVLQSALVDRINKNSFAASVRALEDILDNIGCSVYLRRIRDGEPIFVNRMLRNTFREEWKSGKLRQLVETGDFSKPDSGSFEIYYSEQQKWFDVLYKELEWVDGSRVMLISLYDITERRLYQKRIEQQAFTDFLTGLYNRMCCERDLARMIDQASETGEKGALVYLDLDDFKHINDGLGHQYGDVLLKSISSAMRSIKGIEDTCYRMGGDEFVILVPPDQFYRFEEILQEIRIVFERPWFLKDADYYCTSSIGTVTFPDNGDTVRDVIKKADIAMYESKKSGKNRLSRYSEDQENGSGKRLDMERNMRDAGERGYEEFEVYYQPVIDVEGEKPVCAGAEALVRWNSSKLGFIPPSDFIPLAEYLGLINPIGTHVLEEACRTCKTWNDNGQPDMKVNVNLSVVQLLQPDIVDIVMSALRKSSLDPKNLTLEVTESLAINDMDRMVGILNKIKSVGVSIALDDFGTGYSSLNHIRELPFDVIKIDQSFVRDLDSDDYAQSFVRMVAELADTLHAKICVEGIENAAQYEKLKPMKIKYIQGYYFDRPLKRADFEAKYVQGGKQ